MVFLLRCVMTLPAVLDVARFPADGKNRTALLAAQGCRVARLPVPAGQAAQDAQLRREARYGIVAFIWPGLTGGEIIGLLARLRGGQHDPKRRQELIELFDLDPSKKARAYSKGNRQKVALIAALASDAELLILDEPTSGLDPLMEANFRECVNAERHHGRTVLLSSHILAEAEALADGVTIIRAGRTVETGTLAEMRHLTRTTIDAELAGAIALDGLPGVHDAAIDRLADGGTRLRCEVDNSALNEILGRLSTAGVRTLTCRPPTLEELFLRHYSERPVAAVP
jgi:ABC-2 type transport system ATP-binding protein